MVLSLVLDVHIRCLCLAIHLDRPVTPVRADFLKLAMFTLETLKVKAVINKQRMNAKELLLYLWLFLSLDSTCSVCFRPGKLVH